MNTIYDDFKAFLNDDDTYYDFTVRDISYELDCSGEAARLAVKRGLAEGLIEENGFHVNAVKYTRIVTNSSVHRNSQFAERVKSLVSTKLDLSSVSDEDLLREVERRMNAT